MDKYYYFVRIYYGGDGPVNEYFRTKNDADRFYWEHDRCDKPRKIRVMPYAEQEIEQMISLRELLETEGVDE